jgi:hypothetical protein
MGPSTSVKPELKDKRIDVCWQDKRRCLVKFEKSVEIEIKSDTTVIMT